MNNDYKVRLYLRFLQIPEIGSATGAKIMTGCGGIENVFNATSKEIAEKCGLSQKITQKIFLPIDEYKINEKINQCRNLGIEAICYEDPTYPSVLKAIDSPPLLLYCKGQIPKKWNYGIAIVGSRNPTPYGIKIARRLAYQIARVGFAVISDCALGIDTHAHLGALAAEGITWAVMGSGLDRCYPPQNLELLGKVMKKGLILSEFPPGTAPSRSTVFLKNRIISGLSIGVVVVEAAQGCASLLIARIALEQDRQLFAIPGRIDNPYAFGPNQLIKEGAKLVCALEDILEEISYLSPLVYSKTGDKARASKIKLSKDE
ncbi:DNA-protecting protein DprA [Candidatus Methylacidiphilum fumarolicum]|uniref:Rossmann fold nucleotide-binding protein involved in DNA uptake n=2 Tax=Candidatus Methylacidiphilum fumarolicum TaxID=591154 RepID=I0JWV9_METFB|nr:DNA-processing protein DprA [Candidatus Methylacidiphilum fumarolicum]MBW6414423.1 DNA-processing protein DprA [Candidatus Methylacidiphilum fumarolicum]TFE69425.1 DNA protecting protein DprA [Candidatus Methylacidiphilum fumarolicum]TFE72869.1 DNA-protecting protein DprA [Candidatus Methylacidiphilum fumarolicum]TFE74612.1 DNA-protecting protein DprA [Candidatus Methylacidiphilum fumarolicum]TFE77179.1 DNA protecting protein DprA [Candidatus Methylacidiphilum fumarolicum]